VDASQEIFVVMIVTVIETGGSARSAGWHDGWGIHSLSCWV